MGVKTLNDETPSTKYVFNRKAGRSLIERRPVFSPDGESILIIVENVVRVYNIQTGDCIRTLETEGSINELVAVQFLEDEDYNLYGCSDSGLITTWTWEHGAVLREVQLQIPNFVKVCTFNLINSNECFVTSLNMTTLQVYLARHSIKNGSLGCHYINTNVPYFEVMCVAIGWCFGDRFAAITNGTKILYIQNLYKPHLRTEIHSQNEFRILSVAAHHRENMIAITDTLGRVTILRGNLYDYRQIAREVLHWHALPPFASCFSTEGNYLITGGLEKVLVKWTLGTLAQKAHEKIFIPRLPGFIRYITANNSHIAVTLSNNSVVIASSLMYVETTILECGGLSPVCRALGASLVYYRPMSALLMPGRTGYLQLYSTVTNKVLYNIDITQVNSLTSERHNLIPLELEVTCAAISADGSWLVTSEYRNDGVNYPEEKLKFFAAKTIKSRPFGLNTCVDLSHGGCRVVSLALNNKGEFCVSSGTDQKFRIWKRETTQHHEKRTQQYIKTTGWYCLTACYYSSGIAYHLRNPVHNKFKVGKNLHANEVVNYPYMKEITYDDVIKTIFNIHKNVGQTLVDKRVAERKGPNEFSMGGVAISQDGSLIAAWFGCKLTLWDSHLCNLRTTLSHPALRPKGVNVQFGNNDAAHYLVCTTNKCLAVWSLLSLTIKWMVQIETTCLVSDPYSNKMAMLTTNNDVYVFSPHSSIPILVQKGLLDPAAGVCNYCAFGSSSPDTVRLYVMRNDSEIYCLEPEKSEEGRLEVISRRNLPPSAFSALMAEQTLYDVKSFTNTATQELNKAALANTAISQFLSAAPHMVPPVSMLCPLFLQHISGYKEVEQSDDEEGPMEVDLPTSDDEDLPAKSTRTPKPALLWAPSYEQVKEKRLKKMLRDPLLDLDLTSSVFGV
ncbi:WD repeat-containing protein 75 [Maniola jurtina]|uniref:WD repeat-containing protein 75 n=1 Tax=Maniola jurtina TaxID=191418 RepID=UPI001E68D279|nr:WD repeat-containing protein 75 [Maniola jurtina]